MTCSSNLITLPSQLSTLNAQSARGAFRGAQTAGNTLKWRGQVIMKNHVPPQALSHANKAANASFFIKTHYARFISAKRHHRTHVNALATLIAHRNTIGAIFPGAYPYGALFFIHYFIPGM